MTTKRIEILDHGYVQLVEAWGSDESIVTSARMSTGRGFLGWGPDNACLQCGGSGRHSGEIEVWDELPTQVKVGPTTMRLVGGRKHSERVEGVCPNCDGLGEKPGDEKLLKYLWDNQHASPFEMAGMTIEVQAPIVVVREWHRHRTQGYSERSARYTALPDVNYVPTVDRILSGANQATANKQAQGSGKVVSADDAARWQSDLIALYAHAEEVYQRGLAIGVPKELARLPVPVARYTTMRATACLRNWLAFLKLRCAPAAQQEIREFALAISGLVLENFPRTYAVARESTGLP